MEQQIRFCTSADGVRIAYATVGQGPPLVLDWGWMGNVERDLNDPDGRAFLETLGRRRLLVTFDRRGTGASQRDVDDLSLEAQVADVAAVADHLQLERLDVFGLAEAAAICVAYAAQHPERVSRLVLWAAYPCGEEIARPGAIRGLVGLIRENWSLARRALADIVLPIGPSELQRSISSSLRESVSPETAAKHVEFFGSVDVRPHLSQVKAPTLVLHRRGDRNVPISAGRLVAASIPDARFVALEGTSPWLFIEDSEAVLSAIDEFLGEGEESARGAAPSGLVTILFTDMEGSTTLTQRVGDAKAQEVLRTHNRVVRDALKAHGGSEIKHTGDGIMASFASASRSLECAIAMQRAFAEHNAARRGGSRAAPTEGAPEIRVRIGLNAGEPVAEEEDLFGTAVQLAARVSARADAAQILASNVVRELAAGKGFLFSDQGDVVLRGFEDPVRLFEVRWRES